MFDLNRVDLRTKHYLGLDSDGKYVYDIYCALSKDTDNELIVWRRHMSGKCELFGIAYLDTNSISRLGRISMDCWNNLVEVAQQYRNKKSTHIKLKLASKGILPDSLAQEVEDLKKFDKDFIQKIKESTKKLSKETKVKILELIEDDLKPSEE